MKADKLLHRFACIGWFLYGCSSQQPEPETAYIKCMPFSASTPISLDEEYFSTTPVIEKPGRVLFEKKLNASPKVAKTYQILTGDTSKDTISVDDYDLRLLISFQLADGIQDNFYVSKNKRTLMHNKKFYNLPSSHLKTIINNLDCPCSYDGNLPQSFFDDFKKGL